MNEARENGIPWKKWGPNLSERQWGAVREDYSDDGNAWDCVFDRNAPLPVGGSLEQADGTAWMSFYSQCMAEMAVEGRKMRIPVHLGRDRRIRTMMSPHRQRRSALHLPARRSRQSGPANL